MKNAFYSFSEILWTEKLFNQSSEKSFIGFYGFLCSFQFVSTKPTVKGSFDRVEFVYVEIESIAELVFGFASMLPPKIPDHCMSA